MSDDDYGNLQQPGGSYGTAAGAGKGATSAQKPKKASSNLPVPPSPYPLPSKVGISEAGIKDKLRSCLEAIKKKKPYLKLALADLTDAGEGEVPYVGISDNELAYVGSTAKLSLILPAFSLRHAARQAAELPRAPSDPKKFFEWLDKSWDADFKRGFRRGGAADTKPKLRSILKASTDPGKQQLKIDFTINQDKSLVRSGFRPRLVLAQQLSMNEAAGYCIRDVGYPFIHEAHRAAGIDGPKGLIVGADYWGGAWGGSAPPNQYATARWLAELLVVIARDRLVTRFVTTTATGDSNSEIKDVMAYDREDIAIGIANRLAPDEDGSLTYQGKVGYLEKKKKWYQDQPKKDGPFADCGIITRTTKSGQKLRYVAVALDGKSHIDIREVGADLDDCILAAHGLPPKPAQPAQSAQPTQPSQP